MEQDLPLEKQISIQGILLMLDDKTPHVAVPVQVIYEGATIETVLSDDAGRYEFANLKPGRYQVRCHVLGGYAYYGAEGSIVRDESRAVFLQVGRYADCKNYIFH